MNQSQFLTIIVYENIIILEYTISGPFLTIFRKYLSTMLFSTLVTLSIMLVTQSAAAPLDPNMLLARANLDNKPVISDRYYRLTFSQYFHHDLT